MELVSPVDAAFLHAERREQPMHVGGLQLFEPPPDAGPDHLAALYEQALATTDVAPMFRKRVHRSFATLGQWAWVEEAVDLEHHVRHSALPCPGRIRELLALCSRLHGTLLDRHHPLWEAHLVEGLADGRFAVYTKVHHALTDGISAMRLLQASLSTDPDARDVQMPFATRRPDRRSSDGDAPSLVDAAAGLARDAVAELRGLGPAAVRVAGAALRSQAGALPRPAPKTIFQSTISGSRRFAADSWDLERLRSVGRRADATLNDVLLAMCSGALRHYLAEHDALPDSSLVAMVPASLRGADDDGSAANAVGALLCRLGTDETDPARRLDVVRASMGESKSLLATMSQLQATALSAAVMAPAVLTSLLPVPKAAPPLFNLVISNVPGPRDPLYWNGARLSEFYPLSIPFDGQALNITITTYAGRAQIGVVGCRRTVPHLQHLLRHLETSLLELERAVG